ncbi:MAG: hypothetical protein M3419_04965 [Actinomycetota bacterium]|nr:hypothetical protein [Actinomycetota bacterium]
MNAASTEWARSSSPTVHEIAALMRDLPGPDTSPTERAAWQERKADLLQRIQAQRP